MINGWSFCVCVCCTQCTIVGSGAHLRRSRGCLAVIDVAVYGVCSCSAQAAAGQVMKSSNCCTTAGTLEPTSAAVLMVADC